MPQPNRERGAGPSLSKPEEPKTPRYRGGPLESRPVFGNQSGVMSIGVHLALVLVAIVGLPEFMRSEPPEPMVMTVEVLPITDKTNVKPSNKPLAPSEEPPPPKKTVVPVKPVTAPPPKPAEKVEPEKTEKPEEAEDTPPPAETAENVVPEKPKPAKKVEEKKPEKPKPAAKPTEEKTEKSEKETLDSILKDVQQAAQDSDVKSTKKTSEPTGSKTVSNAPFDASQPMSLSQMDAIKQQLMRCWNPPAGTKDDFKMVVVMRANYAPDGSLIGEPVQVGGVDNFAAVGAAKRALQNPRCAKLQNVPKEKYSAWKQIDVTFDPKYALQ